MKTQNVGTDKCNVLARLVIASILLYISKFLLSVQNYQIAPSTFPLQALVVIASILLYISKLLLSVHNYQFAPSTSPLQALGLLLLMVVYIEMDDFN